MSPVLDLLLDILLDRLLDDYFRQSLQEEEEPVDDYDYGEDSGAYGPDGMPLAPRGRHWWRRRKVEEEDSDDGLAVDAPSPEGAASRARREGVSGRGARRSASSRRRRLGARGAGTTIALWGLSQTTRRSARAAATPSATMCEHALGKLVHVT